MKYDEKLESLFKEIEQELEKFPGDMDCDKIGALLDNVNIDKESGVFDIDDIILYFDQKHPGKVNKTRKIGVWRKFAVAAACFVVMFFVGTIVCSYAMGVNILEGPPSEWPAKAVLFLKDKLFYKEKNIDVYYTKNTRSYSSYDELFEKEHVDFLRIESFPDGYELDRISFTDYTSYDSICVKFCSDSGEDIYYTLHNDKSLLYDLKDTEVFRGLDIVKSDIDGVRQITWIQGDWYTILSGKAPMDVLLQMVAAAK